jgi:hypothetical protein
MILVRRLKKIEKIIIANMSDNYIVFDCTEHGIFGVRNDVQNTKCIYQNCNGNQSKIDNIEELKEKYREYKSNYLN